MQAHPEITRLLGEVTAEDPASMGRLMDAVYADLERMAGNRLRERYGPHLAGVTLEPAALVNETFLRLIKQRKQFDNRGHFFGVATTLMLRVLADHHRQRQALKRGSGIKISLGAVPGAELQTPTDQTAADIPSLIRALEQLDALDPRKGEVAKLRLIWGLELAEIADVVGLSLPTIERDWRFVRAWLAGAITGNTP
jgi:RNA polymerase sigma-70 factor, ECF subfamily